MQKFSRVNYTDEDFVDTEEQVIYKDMIFERCLFERIHFSSTVRPANRKVVKNVTFVNCQQRACGVGSPILEDVTIDGLKNDKAPLFVRGAAFKHVTIKGRIGRLVIRNKWGASVAIEDDDPRVVAYLEANKAYYEKVDWALDISQGEFTDFSIEGIPTHLIRRNPATQAVITREKLLDDRWQTLNYRDMIAKICIKQFLWTNDPSFVLIACTKAPRFELQLHDIEVLRIAGIAEPD